MGNESMVNKSIEPTALAPVKDPQIEGKSTGAANPRMQEGAKPRYGGRQWVCVVLMRA